MVVTLVIIELAIHYARIGYIMCVCINQIVHGIAFNLTYAVIKLGICLSSLSINGFQSSISYFYFYFVIY